jgi:hypothetical protein
VISVQTALRLREAGLRWSPRPGDRFVIAGRGIDDDVFHLADLTIDVHQFPTGPVIGFNGTTEWALDSVQQDEALWMPREDQLRALLGGAFRALQPCPGGYRVTLEISGRTEEVIAGDAEEAYARALLHLVRAATS